MPETSQRGRGGHFKRRRLRWLSIAAAILVAAPLAAQDVKFLRIGTGSTGGTYFPVGGLIANAVSNPPGSRSCEDGGSCGVPGLIAVTQSTQGSVENVNAVAQGALDTALTQADIAYFAYFGKGVFADKGRLDNLRAIASLFPEVVHVVVRRDSGIASIDGLKGLRVNLGEKGSGTLVGARIVLGAHGLDETDVTPSHHKVGKASDLLRSGDIDAYVMVAGTPISAIVEVADSLGIALVSITGEKAAAIRKENPFFAATVIPAGTYKDVGEVETLSVGAQWVTSTKMDADLVYGVTRALWHPNSRKVLDGGHPEGRRIQLKAALDGVAIPLHPGARKFYEEAGLTRDRLQ